MVPRGGIEFWQYQVEFTQLKYQQLTDVPKLVPTENASAPG